MESDFKYQESKPLFAAGGGISQAQGPLFGCASAKLSKSISTQPAGGHDKEGTNLESLQLDIAPSTLEAIFAAQTSHQGKPSPQCTLSSEELSDDNLPSSGHHFHKESLHPSSSEDEQKLYNDECRKRKRKKKKDKHKSAKKKKHKEKKHRSRSPSPKRSMIDTKKISKDKVFLDDIPNLLPEDAFRIDRQSNRDLLRHQSVSKFHIAKYKPFRYSCLGNEEISVPYPERKDNSDKKKAKLSDFRYFGKGNRKGVWKKGFFCSSQTADSKIAKFADFINLPKDKGDEKSPCLLGSYSCLDKETTLYSQGKALQDNVKSLRDDSFVMDEIFEKVGILNQQTREDPNNVELWLRFVNFQDDVAKMDKGFRHAPTSLRDVFQPPRSVIEKKLAILEKAIELNPSSLDLKKAQLELYQDIWESDKVEKAWEDLLFIHASNVDLWRHYLLRQQARLSTFSFTSVLKKYHRCFQTLIPILENKVKVIKKSENLEDELIGVFYQYCTFLHHCGYTERAVSSFQALIEFNLFCPPSLNLDSSSLRKTKFEAFWESNVPKFGESKAMGWAKWEDNKERAAVSPLSSLGSTDEVEDRILQQKLPKFQTWLKMEACRQQAHWIPWKPDETKGEQEDDCEDPDRLALFDDISPSLFTFTRSDNCVKIICLFLFFMGLNSTCMRWLWHDMKDSIFTQQVFEKMYQVPYAAFLPCGLNVGLKWSPHNCVIAFIRSIIEQAEAYFSSSSRILFTLLRLDFELKKTGAIQVQELSKANSKEIKKFGKNLLKESQNRNNLIIWDAFIRLSWGVSEKMEETASMVDVALGMFLDSSALSDPEKSVGILLLCRTFAQITLNFEPLEHVKMKGRRTAPCLEDKVQVMGCLGALVEGKKFKPHSKVDMSPARVLKIRKRFESIMEESLNSASSLPLSVYHRLVALVECSSLFEYCASGFQSGSDVFAKVELKLKELSAQSANGSKSRDSLVLKDLYVAHISFLMNVMSIGSISLGHLRKVLSEALQEFPGEFQFHFFFIEMESGSHIAGRLRSFYEKSLKPSGPISLTLFAVLSEMMRHYSAMKTIEESGVIQSDMVDSKEKEIQDDLKSNSSLLLLLNGSGLLHRIRALCDHCLHPEVGGHCPLLWRMALAFEVSQGDATRAKGILYRALQNCPWSKSIYTDGVALFGDVELQEMNDLMTEKEIRVRIPLEEVDLLLTAEKQSDEEGDIQDKSDLESGLDSGVV